MMTGLHVAVVGPGFGAEFVPIYLDHPDVAAVSICDADPGRLSRTAGRFRWTGASSTWMTSWRSPAIDAASRYGHSGPRLAGNRNASCR